MTKSIGPKKIKTAVFISGKGSNLKNLIKFSKFKKYPFSVNLIISNTKKAKGLAYSKKYRIEKKIIDYDKKIKTDKKNFTRFKSKKNKTNLSRWIHENFVKKFY